MGDGVGGGGDRERQGRRGGGEQGQTAKHVLHLASPGAAGNLRGGITCPCSRRCRAGPQPATPLPSPPWPQPPPPRRPPPRGGGGAAAGGTLMAVVTPAGATSSEEPWPDPSEALG